MRILIHDVETRSTKKLGDVGVYNYAADFQFKLLLFSYAIDYGPVKEINLAKGEKIPSEVLDALSDPTVEKHAFNAAFERIVMSRYLRDIGRGGDLDPKSGYLAPESWRCDMVHALYCGLPMSLQAVGEALGLPVQKDDKGKLWIRKYCIPKKDGTFNELTDNPEECAQFEDYNRIDVETLVALIKRLEKYPVPAQVWKEYAIDQRINDLGVRVDTTLAANAVALNEKAKEAAINRMASITKLDNPNSVLQLRGWLESRGITTDTLGKDKVISLLSDETTPSDVKEVLKLRQVSSKSSTKKYQTMLDAVCPDGRVHGMFQFLGAKTGRWAGRLLQMHNLPRNEMHGAELDFARKLVKDNDFNTLDFLYPSLPQVLSELIRTAFIPAEGFKFVVSDYASIEARVIAYLADEEWRNDAFARGDDIYCLSAEQIYGVPVKKHGINGHLRAKGKIAELACLAKGTPVLTDAGLIPIEDVITDMKVWDGNQWVEHDGVIYKGRQPVVTYRTLTATPDHMVYVNSSNGEYEAMQLAEMIYSDPSVTCYGRVADVYDIVNAGTNHRYMAGGFLVHNCGYGGSTGALRAMDKEGVVPDEELQDIVTRWREASPAITKFWWNVGDAAIDAVRYQTETSVPCAGGKCADIVFSYRSGVLWMKLPSGRSIAYAHPSLTENRFGGVSLQYYGLTTGHKWGPIETYGPRLVENIVQAVSRDLLAHAMELMYKGDRVCMHIHDELVVEVPLDTPKEKISEMMEITPTWAPGLCLKAEAYECSYYQKD